MVDVKFIQVDCAEIAEVPKGELPGVFLSEIRVVEAIGFYL